MATTAAEARAEMAERYRTDPAYRATIDEQKRVRDENAAEAHRKVVAFESDLLAAGVTETGDRMTGKKATDPRIVDVAFKHLAMTGYDEFTRGWIATHLATRAAEPYWDRILAMLRAAPLGTVEAFQLACTLAVCARAKNVEQLKVFVLDSSLGECRSVFLRPINRLGRASGKAFVAQFMDDPDLGWEASRIMRRIGPGAP
jgi:hypothetical protein